MCCAARQLEKDRCGGYELLWHHMLLLGLQEAESRKPTRFFSLWKEYLLSDDYILRISLVTSVFQRKTKTVIVNQTVLGASVLVEKNLKP